MRGGARVLRAAVVAGALSGIPSSFAAVRARRDPLAPTRAAGRMLLPRETRTAPLFAAAALVHAVLSLGWAAVIARVLPRCGGRLHAVTWGASVGAVIAALDLGLARRTRHPRLVAVAELDLVGQLADHVAFGAVTGLMLSQPRARHSA